MQDTNFLSKRVDQLQQGYDELAPGDEIERTNQLLEILVEELTGHQEGYFGGALEQDPGDTSREADDARYDAYTVSATTEEDDLGWQYPADTVVVRGFSEELDVAFKHPEKTNRIITLDAAADDPFIISGAHGLAARRIWYQRGDNAAADTDLNIIAIKRRGR